MNMFHGQVPKWLKGTDCHKQRPVEKQDGKVGELREPLDMQISRAILSQALTVREGAETKRLPPKAEKLW